MKFVIVKVFKDDRFALEKDVDTGNYYVTFPVFNGLAEYSEFYKITEVEFDDFISDQVLLKQFVKACRERKNDDRLLMKPGRLRGDPV